MRLVLASCVVWMACVGSYAAQRSGEATSGGSRIVSPSVVATAIFQGRQGGDADVRLVVLWRGTPGWFLGGRQSGSWAAGGSSHVGGPSTDVEGIVVHRFSFADRHFEVRLDLRAQNVELAGQVVPLGEGRAVLVDDVDGPGGPVVIGVRPIGTRASGEPPRIEPLIRESPELADYLRCHQTLENPQLQALVAGTCRQVLGR